jgi:hypothetical protein
MLSVMSIESRPASPASMPDLSEVVEGQSADPAKSHAAKKKPQEIGGPPGPEPTRYGDWQFNGRVTDF